MVIKSVGVGRRFTVDVSDGRKALRSRFFIMYRLGDGEPVNQTVTVSSGSNPGNAS